MKFGNKNAPHITSQSKINMIKKKINDIGTYDLTGKYYNFLNKKNINCIKPNKFLFTLNTFGKKYILFLTNVLDKQYCIFINKKTPDIMILSQFRFDPELYLGTLFDGELVKTVNNTWKYLITDIIYYKGDNIITKIFKERHGILENVYNNMFQNDNNCICDIELKYYFESKYIKSFCEDYITKKDYKCSGLLFKNLLNFSDNYLYIFLECRSDNKILNNNQTTKINIQIHSDNIKNNSNNDSNNDSKNDSKNDSENNSENNINRDYVVFQVINTHFPDIYELHCKNSTGRCEKHSYGGIPTINTSRLLRKIFKNKKLNNEDEHSSESDLSDIEENTNIKMRCNYHKTFKKWVPYKKTNENIDNINLINHFELYYEK